MFSVSSIAPVLYIIAVLDLIYMSFFLQRNIREPRVSRPLFRPPPSASARPPWWSWPARACAPPPGPPRWRSGSSSGSGQARKIPRPLHGERKKRWFVTKKREKQCGKRKFSKNKRPKYSKDRKQAAKHTKYHYAAKVAFWVSLFKINSNHQIYNSFLENILAKNNFVRNSSK